MEVKIASENAAVANVISGLKSTSARTKEKREEHKLKKTPGAVEKIWNDALREYFPKAPRFGWKRKQLGQAKKFLTKLQHDCDLNDFFRVIIMNWSRITGEYLNWLKKPPVYPDIGLVLAFPGPFWEAYSAANADGFTPRPVSSKTPGGASTGDLDALKKQNAKLAAMLDQKDRELKRFRRKLRVVKPRPVCRSGASNEELKEWLD